MDKKLYYYLLDLAKAAYRQSLDRLNSAIEQGHFAQVNNLAQTYAQQYKFYWDFTLYNNSIKVEETEEEDDDISDS